MKRTLVIVTVLFCITTSASLHAGSLNPPAPPTAGTMKPLDQVEPRTPISSVPYTITQSGSYYLTQNLTSTDTGITVNANDVTIDLCGFTLTGPGNTSGSNYGISLGIRRNVEIRNGTIKSFGRYGVYESGDSAKNNRILKIQAFYNGIGGIYLRGEGDVVKDCQACYNGAGSIETGTTVMGIMTGRNSMVTDNVVYNNGPNSAVNCYVYGIFINNESTASNNTIGINGMSSTGEVYGIYSAYNTKVINNNVKSQGTGIRAQKDAVVSDNSVDAEGSNGISTENYCRVVHNIVKNCPGSGILMGNHCTAIENTTISNSGDGITAGTYCMISKCTSNNNVQRGINAGDNSTIADCTASLNSGEGISAGNHVSLTGNTAVSNTSWGLFCNGGYVARNNVSLNNTANTSGRGGIYVYAASQVRENTLEGNAQNNIYIGGFRNTIENNMMSGSGTGIYFNQGGNYYTNNRGASNAINYSNTSGNTDGGGNISF